jgi:TlyA family rRNA methyltransferase/putative hemolysin
MPHSPRRLRLDQLLVERGLAPSRAKAQAIVLAGRVLVGGTRVDKAGTLVAHDADVALKGDAIPFVSRGGVKLAGAIDALGVPIAGLRCLDVGASTGGFTDCLLQRGASSVAAVDVGYGQLADKLRHDPRVLVRERTNARELQPEAIGGPVDLTVVDASFIGLGKLLPAIARCTRGGGQLLALVKPQFEVGRDEAKKTRGVVRDAAVRARAIERVASEIRRCRDRAATSKRSSGPSECYDHATSHAGAKRRYEVAMTSHAMAHERKPSLGAIFLTIVIDLLGFGLALPFLAEVARTTFHTSSLMGTLLASSYSAMQFLFVPFWGRISDRVGRKPVLAWSIAATALANLGLALGLAYGSSIAWLFVARMFGGFATANLGTASAYIADITPPKDRAKGMGLIGMAFGIGFVLGPGLGGVLAQIPLNGRHGPWALFLAAGLSVINFFWVLGGLVESLPPEARKKPQPTEARRSPIDVKKTLEVLADSSIARAVLTNFTLILFFSGMEQTMRYYNKDGFGMTLSQTGILLVVIGLTGAAVQGGIVRRLSGRVEDASMLKVGLVLQAIAFVGITAAPSFGQWMLYLSGIVLALGNGLTQPATSAFISKRAKSGEQGVTLGVNQSMSSLARATGPALAGFVYDALGIRSPFALGAVGMVVALVVALPLRDAAAT